MYLFVTASCACIFGASIYFCTWIFEVAGCPLVEDAGSYLAYCSDPRYGDYEHLAYALNLVPAAVNSAKQAKVIVLGNSRTQVAFSTPQVDHFFRSQSITYQILGFGYGETVEFAEHLFREYNFKPRILIINVDPFFERGLTKPAVQAIAAGAQVWLDGSMKTAFEHIHGSICHLSNDLCRRTSGSVYRSAETGQWLWHNYNTSRDIPGEAITSAKARPITDADIEEFSKIAARTLPSFNVPSSCIILTSVPTPQIDGETIAMRLGSELGLPVVIPNIKEMRSSDGSHLATVSAERWSDAFLVHSAPIMKQCISTGP